MTGDSVTHDPVGEERVALQEPVEAVDELSGKLASSPDEERLMRSLLENDSQAIADGKVIAEAINQSVGSFTPDLMFRNLVQNYRNAVKLYGETLIRALTEYTPDYVRKNLSIPEFRDALLQRMEESVEGLKERGLLDQQGFITDRGMALATLVMYAEELEALVSKGVGKKELKERDLYGEKEETVPFIKGRFRFRDLSLQQSLKTAVRRGHSSLELADLKAHRRARKGRIQVVYAMDASGSMRGEKLRMAKRAGIALAFTAIEEKNEAGLVVFTSKVERAIPPTTRFPELLEALVAVRAGMETNLAVTIQEAASLFSGKGTRHLLILTDAVPTKGKEPRKATLEASSAARDAGVTISVVGIALDEEGERLAREVVEIGEGRLYRVKNLDELDAVILEDYDALSARRGPEE